MSSIICDIPYTPTRGTRNCYDLYLPDGDGKCPLIIYFYGGGLKKGHKEGNKFAAAAAKRGAAVAVCDYRLMPDAAYPTFIEDAADAVASITSTVSAHTDRISKIYVGGHSAGAYLCMMLCFDRHYLDGRGVDRSSIAGWLLISGQPTKHYNILEQQGQDPRACVIDDTAALFHVRSGEGEPLFIATSDNDMPCRREQNLLLLATLRHFEYRSYIQFENLGDVSHSGMVKPNERGDVPVLPAILDFISKT